MNRSCLAGLLCLLPTICVAADVVIRLPQALSVTRNVVTYACQGPAADQGRVHHSGLQRPCRRARLRGSACVCRRAVRVRSPICGRPLHLVGEGNQCGPLRPAAGRRRETDRPPGGWTRLIQGAQVGVGRLSAEVLIFKRPLWNARSADCADNITLSRSPIFRHADDEQGDRAMPILFGHLRLPPHWSLLQH